MNLQQIPRSNIQIKPIFKAPSASERIENIIDKLILNPYDSLETVNGWVKVKDLNIGDKIKDEESSQLLVISNIKEKNNQYTVWFKN